MQQFRVGQLAQAYKVYVPGYNMPVDNFVKVSCGMHKNETRGNKMYIQQISNALSVHKHHCRYELHL